MEFDQEGRTDALFLAPNGELYPSNLICSGSIPSILGGKPCPFSRAGSFPGVSALEATAENYSIDKGRPGDLFPPCCKHQLGHLGHWIDPESPKFPSKLYGLRLFKCRQWFLLLVPGLQDAKAQILQENDP